MRGLFAVLAGLVAGLGAALADWAERYPAGALVVDGVPYRGGLAFRIYNAVERREAVEPFLKRVVKNKPGPLARAGTLRFLVLAHLGLIGAATGLLTAWVLGRRREF